MSGVYFNLSSFPSLPLSCSVVPGILISALRSKRGDESSKRNETVFSTQEQGKVKPTPIFPWKEGRHPESNHCEEKSFSLSHDGVGESQYVDLPRQNNRHSRFSPTCISAHALSRHSSPHQPGHRPFSFFLPCPPPSTPVSFPSCHLKRREQENRFSPLSLMSGGSPITTPACFLSLKNASSFSSPSLATVCSRDFHGTHNRPYSSPTQSIPASIPLSSLHASDSQQSSYSLERSHASSSSPFLSAQPKERKTSVPSSRQSLRFGNLRDTRRTFLVRCSACSSSSSPPPSSSSAETASPSSVLFPTVKGASSSSAPSESPSDFFEPVLGVQFSPTIFIPSVSSRGQQQSTPHDCVGVAPRCMHDLCWIPAARAYAIGVYIHRDTLEQWRRLYGRMEENAKEKVGNREEVTTASRRDETVKRKEEEDGLAGLFLPAVEKTLVFTFVNNKDPAHILRGFERALQNTAPQHLPSEDKDVLSQEISTFLGLIRRCSFKASSCLAVALIPSSCSSSLRSTNETEEEDDIKQRRRSASNGETRSKDFTEQTMSSDEDKNPSLYTIVIMYKDSSDDRVTTKESEREDSMSQYECLGVCKDVRFLSLALHALYLNGWKTSHPRYTSIAQKFRIDAEKQLHTQSNPSL
ncbi:hypothetical protein CSUI_002753 [Cystoisospora suis]|uniref:Uncharacterized protein n=1 Tax=Cystoisospora suis TaxID=483139 RepID=A0A2C6L7W5_9APIC|nr:hypothetical protein CSUI_002753 [Cystoisospora suis]